MDLGLTGRTVFVTGASGGIGRALAEAFAREGANVALHCRTQHAALAAFVAERPWARNAHVVRADVTDPRALAAAFDDAARRFGRIDACIANAGVWPHEAVPLHRMREDRVRDVIAVNLLGAVWTARAFLEGLARSGPRADGDGASLVFIGSTAGRFGEHGHAEYAASKAGLRGLMLSLKNEIVRLDPQARVNLVEPGWTATPMTGDELEDPQLVARVLATMPLRQLARAADVAAACVWLSSPVAARHITGEVLTLAGGMEGRRLWQPDEIDAEAVRRNSEQPPPHP
jgi:3-oxoacyl-[acyl-carrier protein] reductase